MILVSDRGPNLVLRAQVTHGNGDDQGVRLVACHLDEASSAQRPPFVVFEVTEVLHLEESTRLRARDPRLAAAPCASPREQVELFVDGLDPVLREAVQAVVKNSRHSET